MCVGAAEVISSEEAARPGKWIEKLELAHSGAQ